jgi:hypothetical protein
MYSIVTYALLIQLRKRRINLWVHLYISMSSDVVVDSAWCTIVHIYVTDLRPFLVIYTSMGLFVVVHIGIRGVFFFDTTFSTQCFMC